MTGRFGVLSPDECLPKKTGCLNSSSIIQTLKEKKNDNECILETSKKLLKIDFPYIMLPCETQLYPGLLRLGGSSLCSFGNSIARHPCLWWSVWYSPWGSATDRAYPSSCSFFQVTWEWIHFRLARKLKYSFLKCVPACFGLFFSPFVLVFLLKHSTKQPFVFQLLDVGLVNMKQEHHVCYSEWEKMFDRCGAFI